MSGNAGFPSLVDIATRRSAAQVDSIIRNGSGRMPAFSSISAATRAELVKYLMGGKVKATQASPHPPQ
jgi:quinoprotein glucose dehydrogenase